MLNSTKLPLFSIFFSFHSGRFSSDFHVDMITTGMRLIVLTLVLVPVMILSLIMMLILMWQIDVGTLLEATSFLWLRVKTSNSWDTRSLATPVIAVGLWTTRGSIWALIEELSLTCLFPSSVRAFWAFRSPSDRYFLLIFTHISVRGLL